MMSASSNDWPSREGETWPTVKEMLQASNELPSVPYVDRRVWEVAMLNALLDIMRPPPAWMRHPHPVTGETIHQSVARIVAGVR